METHGQPLLSPKPGRNINNLSYPFLEIEVIVDSHAVVRNNTERSLGHFAHIYPVVTFCKTIV